MDKLTIPAAALPRVGVPSVLLPGRDAGRDALRIPPAILSALVCWYSPRRQGCTNEGMRTDPVLRDLSGNGLDMECLNFAWNEASGVDSDGNLSYDGIDDFSVARGIPALSDFSVISSIDMRGDRQKFVLLSTLTDLTSREFEGNCVVETATCDAQVISYGQVTKSVPAVKNRNGKAIIHTTPTYATQGDTKSEYPRGTLAPAPSTLVFALVPGWNVYAKSILHSFILFNRTLSDSEADWVIRNITD